MLEARRTKDLIEFTVFEEGRALFLSFSIRDMGEEYPAEAYLTVRYYKESCFTPNEDDGTWMGCRIAHEDYLDSLMLYGEIGLYKRLTETYNSIVAAL